MLAQNLLEIQNQAGITNLPLEGAGLFSTILPYIFFAAGLLLLIYLIFGGFQFMYSRGDPKATQSAKDKITNALIGFVIVIMAYGLVSLLGRVLRINPFILLFGDM